ncbi:lytic polysaccharide monooxygenase [Streptomyces sp. NPDC020807]|uniref:lytic polysaccharide monooxygenase auxiliary activity family 9 protein n=1 Tax=Streptomyces sp. NPDC020807 TaxID=3155119 RepID=UPI003406DB59
MTSRRTAPVVTALLGLSGLAVSPAHAHGSMTDPVSRVAACYAEGPEAPRSAACRAAVAASGPQAFYDWNAVNIANAAGQHRQLIPDGKLCSAGNDKYRGLDLARADWPAGRMNSGSRTFRYRGTAPHKGAFALYVTKDGYDPTKPLAWSDLEGEPFATATDPRMENGDYVFDGTVPAKSGRHLIYAIWQRSDSPEAFYSCSDVVFGGEGGAGTTPTPTASAPNEQPSGEPSAEHDHSGTSAAPEPEESEKSEGSEGSEGSKAEGDGAPNAPSPAGGSEATDTPAPAAPAVVLAETGGGASRAHFAVGGAAVLSLGAALFFGAARRRARG